MKKGQASMFLVVGVVLLVVIFFTLLVSTAIDDDSSHRIQSTIFTPSEKLVLGEYINACLTRTTYNALHKFGAQGGYLYPSFFIESMMDDDVAIPYYYYKGNNFFPSHTFFETAQLSEYIYYTMDDCISDFVPFKGLTIQESDKEVTATIEESTIVVSLSYPLTVTQGDREEIVEEDYSIEIPVRIGTMLSYASLLTEKTTMSPTLIDLSTLLLIRNEGFDITVIPYTDGVVLYRMRDTTRELEGKQYVFQFAMKVSDT